jgi:hypothetical protein
MSPKTKLEISKADFAFGRLQRSSLAISRRNGSLLCAALVSLTTAVLISETPLALAQDQATTRHVPAAAAAGEEQRFIIESDLAISKMSLAMTADRAGDVERDFVAMMMPHHQGAIDIARAELKYGRNEALRQLARDIIVEQEREMSVMRGAVGETPPAQSSDTPSMESMSEHATSGRSGKE